MKRVRFSLAIGLRNATFATSSSLQPRFHSTTSRLVGVISISFIRQYTTCFKLRDDDFQQKAVYTGNHVKSMLLSVEASLKKLRTKYIDILYVHWWDFETSVEEVMNGLHTLILQGKVLYLVRFFYIFVASSFFTVC
jgi:hypothetical protein